jgi:threonyl-tRNA synthetase
MALPEKFELEYMDSDGMLKRPVMLHRTIYGSIERFFGVLIEHFAGKFPLWISPLPIRVITVADRHSEYAHHLMKEIKKAGFICDVDDTSESVNKKIRNAQLLQINYMLTVGDKEVENKTLNLRTRDNVVHGELELHAFLQALQKEMETKSLESEFAHAHDHSQ